MVNDRPFAGRLGGNQQFTVDPNDPDQESLLERVPDAAPAVHWRDVFSLVPFRDPYLYKAAVIEGIGMMLLTFVTGFLGLSPNVIPAPPTGTAGPFSTTTFLGPLTAFLPNMIIITMLIYSFGAMSGAHFNPLITLGTFCARLTTFARAVLYISAQLIGGSLGGLLLRAAANTRDFKVGGCYLFEDEVFGAPNALVVEFCGCSLILFLAFGIGLDPRQAELFGPGLSPPLVGLSVAAVGYSLGFSHTGYGGASLNPGRCFGVFVGSRFGSWTWVNWVGAILASVSHGIVYALVPPGLPGEGVRRLNTREAVLRHRFKKMKGDATEEELGKAVEKTVDEENDGRLRGGLTSNYAGPK